MPGSPRDERPQGGDRRRRFVRDRHGPTSMMHCATPRPYARTAALALVLAAALGAPLPAHAGAQVEEQLSASVVMGLQRAIADDPPPRHYENEPAVRAWIADM